MDTISIYIDSNNFAYDLGVIKETTETIHAVGMYGDEYRIHKDTKDVFKNDKYMGVARTLDRY